MSCLIKQKTSKSPGIMIFTHDELMHGVISKSEKVRQHLIETARNKEWIYGIHVQGDLTSRKDWPYEDWQRFIMWPNPASPFVSNVPKNRVLPLGCIHFTPDFIKPSVLERQWDLCIVSRPSTIKRIYESMVLVKKIMTLRPQTSIIFIAPDPRDISKGEKTYTKDRIDRRYFDLPMSIFTSRELKNICFLSPSSLSFGNFPISLELVAHIMSLTKFMLLTSHREGGPRVIVESMAAGTPCIISKNLRCGIFGLMNKDNTIVLDDEVDSDANKIIQALDNYHLFKVDQNMVNKFKENYNVSIFERYLKQTITELGCPIEGKWYLNELNFRLAGHGYKHNIQFLYDPESFFYWVNNIEQDPYNEDIGWRKEKIPINIPLIINRNIAAFKGFIKKVIRYKK